MALFKRRGGAAAVVDLPPVPESAEALEAEIARLTAANREHRDGATERRLLALRHALGLRRLDVPAEQDIAVPDPDALPDANGLPEFLAADLTPGLLRAGILRDGCVLVRGLVPRASALRLADGIGRAFAARQAGEGADFYVEFEPDTYPPVSAVRPWVAEGGGVLATDSPRVGFEMLEVFASAGLPALIGGYLGEPPLLSAQKTTLRKAEPTVGGAWHQDGAFMGEVKALNLWLSLSRCGDLAPGLDLVPRRVEEVVIGHDDMLDVALTRAKAEEAAGDVPIVRPVFEPGDALFFDELFLHQTASDPSMPNPRFAIESWFFGGSAFPGDYAPFAV